MHTELKVNNGLVKKDFVSDQDVRWCPGCGDYVILNTLQKALTQINKAKEDIVCISGIGCSSRLPYYMDTYGIHSIHGRAAAVATGVKLANPNLSVWIITGDGDSMAIGGNHLIHAARRNVDMNMIIFNNKIYGMTKGQSSPTTPLGLRTKTAPEGSYEPPFNIGELVIGAGATFFARVPDNDPKLMEEVLLRAEAHKGFAVVEVLQNCVIFTNGIHEEITDRENKDENQLILEKDQTMIFGKEQKYGFKVRGMKLEKIPLDDENITDPELLKHDPSELAPELHMALVRMKLPDFPLAMGVIREVTDISFDVKVHKAITDAKERSTYKNVQELFHSGHTWKIN